MGKVKLNKIKICPKKFPPYNINWIFINRTEPLAISNDRFSYYLIYYYVDTTLYFLQYFNCDQLFPTDLFKTKLNSYKHYSVFN